MKVLFTGRDALFLVTEGKANRRGNWTAMKSPLIFDGCNLQEPYDMQDTCLHYVVIGTGGQG